MPAIWEGKVAFITGASSGIGEALALEFAMRGAHVVLFARRRGRLQNLAARIRAMGGRSLVAPGNVESRRQLEEAMQAAVQEFGGIDFVVANAGTCRKGNLASLELEDYRRQFETNVYGVLSTVQAGMPVLRRSGTLLLMGSVASYVSSPGASAYSMSKFAVRALAEALRHELHPYGISVVLACPGYVATRLTGWRRDGPPKGGSMMAPETAARLILDAVHRKDQEIVLSRTGRLKVLAARYFPALLDWLFRRRVVAVAPEWTPVASGPGRRAPIREASPEAALARQGCRTEGYTAAQAPGSGAALPPMSLP